MAPDSAEVLMAWANLLSAMVQTMRDESVGVDVTCRFWDVYTPDSGFYDDINPGAIGDCRRRALRISEELLRRTLPGPNGEQFATLANDLYLPSVLPVTARESWCGEYQDHNYGVSPC